MATRTRKPATTPPNTIDTTPTPTSDVVVTPTPPSTIARMSTLRDALDTIRPTPRITSPDVAHALVATVTSALGANAPAPVNNRCRFTALPVAMAQNVLFVANETDGWGFSDDVLAVAWAVMFPVNNARIAGGAGFTSRVGTYIGGTRSLFNGGKHGGLPADVPMRRATGRAARPAPADVVANAVMADMVAATDATITAA